MSPFRLPCLAIALAFAAVPSFAQQVISAKSGLLSYAEGQVTLNDEPVDFSGVHFSDVKENGVVRTADGRAEILLTPGVILRMGENTSLRMITNRLVDTRLELLTGSAVVEADQIAKDTSLTIVCKSGVVTLPKAGLYRFDTEPAQIKVFKGDAEVELAGETKTVSGGHMLALAAETASIQKFDTEDTDSLDRWSHRRGSYLAMANASAANSLMNGGGYGGYGLGGYGLGGYGMAGWGMRGCSSAWAYNGYFDMMTYMPCYGSLYSPYGYRFYSPYSIYGYSGFAPTIYGGGASRTGNSGSGSASLARPAATASNRSNAPAVGVGGATSRGGFATSGGRVGSTASAASSSSSAGFSGFGGSSAGSGGGGFSGGGSGGGFSGGHASGGSAGASGGHSGGGASGHK